MRYENWKLVFAEQRAEGTLRIWAEPFTNLRVPLMFDLRADPYERAQHTSNTYYDWLIDHAFLLVPAQAFAGKFLATFKDFPPAQKPDSFSLETVIKNDAGGRPLQVAVEPWARGDTSPRAPRNRWRGRLRSVPGVESPREPARRAAPVGTALRGREGCSDASPWFLLPSVLPRCVPRVRRCPWERESRPRAGGGSLP